MRLFQGVVLLLVGILLMAGGIIKMRNASRALDVNPLSDLWNLRRGDQNITAPVWRLEEDL